jgi:hypothetical protein
VVIAVAPFSVPLDACGIPGYPGAVRTLLLALLLAAAASPVAAKWGLGDGGSSWSVGDDRSPRLRRFDPDAVVEATTRAMADAARDYYLPDGRADKKAVASYARDARWLASHDSTFRRELARVIVAVAADADASDSPERKYLPAPVPLDSRTPVEVGVSSITESTVRFADGGEEKAYDTNTMPCIDAAAKAMHDSTLAQFPEVGKDAKASAAYMRAFDETLTTERLYNHALAEVCEKMVRAARDEARSAEKRRK